MCGIVGMRDKEKFVASNLYVALLQMQHRGKESAGIVVDCGNELLKISGSGEVPQVFSEESLSDLRGEIGIAQVRYSTFGGTEYSNIPPVQGKFKGFDFFLVHNGNLVNTEELRKITKSRPAVSDTKVIADLISLSSASSFEEAIIETIKKLRGGFNLIFIFNKTIYAVRDNFGFHPLQLGIQRENYIIASESCVFDHLGAKFLRDVSPGEFIVLDENGIKSYASGLGSNLKIDIFEYIYFLRPDSVVHGVEAGLARYFMGRALAEEHPILADVIIPIPDSGNEATLGYYEYMVDKGVRMEFRPWALFRPHTVSRTFIEPVQNRREYYLNLKFNPRPLQLKGKSVLMIDDSLVRGNTISKVEKLLKNIGARSVSALIASPMYLFPDFYGIDTYRAKNELIAKKYNGDIRFIKENLGLEYLNYLNIQNTIDAVLKARGENSVLTKDNFYTGPFNGEYPAGTGDFAI